MLERVAREIARHAAVDGGKTLDTADGFSDAAWSDFVDVARAVLETLREPTADMISAAIKKDPSPRYHGAMACDDRCRAFD